MPQRPAARAAAEASLPPLSLGDRLRRMSDREAILGLLTGVERRLRGNRMLRDASAGFAAALLVPVAFKLVDLISSFRGTTVVAVFTTWFFATAFS